MQRTKRLVRFVFAITFVGSVVALMLAWWASLLLGLYAALLAGLSYLCSLGQPSHALELKYFIGGSVVAALSWVLLCLIKNVMDADGRWSVAVRETMREVFPQFRLRTLLLVVTAAALLFGGITALQRNAEPQPQYPPIVGPQRDA